jgi:protein-S-isoprenylcysteine O-methyltransferase Ste14
VSKLLARLRVSFGFVCGVLVWSLASPTWSTIVAGVGVAAVGECLRFWAAGHVNKGREVTASGPYRWVAHPLYLGSAMIGVGLAIAANRVVVAFIIGTYLAIMLSAAILSEEAFLARSFGEAYLSYRRGDLASDRTFSVGRAIANREHRALAGFVIAVLLLVLRATYNGVFWR